MSARHAVLLGIAAAASNPAFVGLSGRRHGRHVHNAAAPGGEGDGGALWFDNLEGPKSKPEDGLQSPELSSRAAVRERVRRLKQKIKRNAAELQTLEAELKTADRSPRAFIEDGLAALRQYVTAPPPLLLPLLTPACCYYARVLLLLSLLLVRPPRCCCWCWCCSTTPTTTSTTTTTTTTLYYY